MPLRVIADQFKPNRSQRRAWSRHQALARGYSSWALYRNTIHCTCAIRSHRHAGGGMDEDSVDQYTQFLLQSRVNTHLVEFRETLPDGSYRIIEDGFHTRRAR
jgi:arginyl-tRNA--protein-N-Asp/Glu arginylyltransferase